jgi:hypothetical protein
MWREGRRETVVGSGLVEMKDLRSAFQQVRGHIAGLIVHPSGRAREAYLPPGTGHFQRTEPVQDYLDFSQTTLGQHQQEIVAGQPRGKIRPATRLSQTPGKLFQGQVGCGRTVELVDLLEVIKMNRGEAQRAILALGAYNLFPKLLFDEGPVVKSGGGVHARWIGELGGIRFGTCAIPEELLSHSSKNPLTKNEPAIEQKQQAHDSPTGLIGSNFVKMFAVAEESLN